MEQKLSVELRRGKPNYRTGFVCAAKATTGFYQGGYVIFLSFQVIQIHQLIIQKAILKLETRRLFDL